MTKTGKLLRRRSFARHLRSGKTKSRIRNLKRPVVIGGAFRKKLKHVFNI